MNVINIVLRGCVYKHSTSTYTFFNQVVDWRSLLKLQLLGLLLYLQFASHCKLLDLLLIMSMIDFFFFAS